MSFLLAFVGLVLAVVALTRTKALASLQQRVSELENDQTDLRRRFNTLRREAAPQEVPAPSPASAPVPAAIERPAPPPPPPPPLAPPTPPRVATPTPPAELPPPEPPKPPFDWERWIGIRGAAVLGGIALALAGLLFFQYSIQHGLISKTMRVTLGFITGVLCLTGSEWVRRRGYRPASEGLAGAGVVVLYAAVWAGYARYQLLPLWVAFLLMALVTAACGLLAVRRAAPFVAILGTVGGFATPLLLSIQRERPLGLFGYVLLLDIGLLAVGKRQRWPWIGLIGLGGTVLLQALWLGTRTGPGGLLLSLAILAVFAAVFTIGGFARGTEGESPWRGMQAGGLLLPFVFAVYFASRADLGRHLWGIAAFAALLGIGASWSGKKAGLPALGSAAATGSLATLAVWLLRTPATPGIAWEAVAIASGFAAIYHVALEWNGEVDGMFGPSPAAVVTSVGGAVLLLVASMMTPLVPPWPWLAGWLVLGALLVRQADLTRLPALQVIASGGVAAMFGLQHVAHAKAEAFPPPGTYAGAALGVAVLAQVVPFLRRDHDMRRSAEHGAAVAAVALSVTLLMSPLLVSLPTVVALGLPVAFGLLILLAATRLGEGEWGLGAVLVTALVHASWTFVRPHGAPDPPSVPTAMLLMFAAVVLFVAWPFLARGRIASTRWIWWAAAAAGPLWFFPLRKLGMVWPGPATIG
ncbi:MAG TPA: DUF2339 domain-containing protein, partial [Candidatus Polarisedimenticolaceae bacterium]|nr:DUF2339 domain-containing protein [Candidatus Polarisedimenticolaceae bacterium]